MLDLPLGKALIAVPRSFQCKDECMKENYHCTCDCCCGCDFKIEDLKDRYDGDEPCEGLYCKAMERKDRLHVVYKLIEYPDKNA